MKFVWTVLFCLLALPARAQQDSCPVKHLALTALDHTSMLAAYTASYVGLFGHAPSMQPGSGSSDGNYWIAVSDHYGAFSDGVCRAGWNRYWEQKLLGADSLSPSLGDQPAQFQPAAPAPTPIPVPVPVPPPTPVPTLVCPDMSAIQAELVQLNLQVTACNQGIASVAQNVTDGRQENQTFFASVKSVWAQIGGPLLKYVVPAVTAFLAGKKL